VRSLLYLNYTGKPAQTVMVQVIQASELTLHDVKKKFNLQQVDDELFFQEWQGDLPSVTDAQKEWLDRVKANFLYLAEYPMHEEIVKMVFIVIRFVLLRKSKLKLCLMMKRKFCEEELIFWFYISSCG
jgi:hypothetical protein